MSKARQAIKKWDILAIEIMNKKYIIINKNNLKELSILSHQNLNFIIITLETCLKVTKKC